MLLVLLLLLLLQLRLLLLPRLLLDLVAGPAAVAAATCESYPDQLCILCGLDRLKPQGTAA